METPIDRKYVVVKRDGYEAWKRKTGYTLEGVEEVPDAVVIRRQDFLSVGILELYATNISMIRQILIETGAFDEAAQLKVQQDYFDAQASAARVEARKLPD